MFKNLGQNTYVLFSQVLLLNKLQQLWSCYCRGQKYVLLGAHDVNRFTGTEKFVKIEKWITHPNARDFSFDRPYGQWIKAVLHYDFSLLLLSQKVKFTSYILPIALPSTSDQDYSGKFFYTSGWGNTEIFYKGGRLAAKTLSNVPKKVFVQAVVHDTNACRAEGYDVKDMCKHCGRKEVICTYGKQHFNKTIVEDACGGDSGGIIA